MHACSCFLAAQEREPGLRLGRRLRKLLFRLGTVRLGDDVADDHLVLAMVPFDKTNDPNFGDLDIVVRSHEAYRSHALPRSLDKAFGFSHCLAGSSLK